MGWAKNSKDAKAPVLDIWGEDDEFNQKAAGINNTQADLMQQMENTRKMLEQPNNYGQFNSNFSAGNPFAAQFQSQPQMQFSAQNQAQTQMGMMQANPFMFNQQQENVKLDPFSNNSGGFNVQQQPNGMQQPFNGQMGMDSLKPLQQFSGQTSIDTSKPAQQFSMDTIDAFKPMQQQQQQPFSMQNSMDYNTGQQFSGQKQWDQYNQNSIQQPFSGQSSFDQYKPNSVQSGMQSPPILSSDPFKPMAMNLPLMPSNTNGDQFKFSVMPTQNTNVAGNQMDSKFTSPPQQQANTPSMIPSNNDPFQFNQMKSTLPMYILLIVIINLETWNPIIRQCPVHSCQRNHYNHSLHHSCSTKNQTTKLAQ